MDLKSLVLFMVPRVLTNMKPLLSTLAMSLVPITVFNAVMYFLLFMIVYMMNLFGWANVLQCGCKDNNPVQGSTRSMWSALTKSYWLYLPIALMVNYSIL